MDFKINPKVGINSVISGCYLYCMFSDKTSQSACQLDHTFKCNREHKEGTEINVHHAIDTFKNQKQTSSLPNLNMQSRNQKQEKHELKQRADVATTF